MRRAVIEALRNRKQPNPFSLPSDLPNTIMLANLAGDHVMIYDHGFEMVAKLIDTLTPAENQMQAKEAIETMVTFAKGESRRSLLFIYCMPPLEEPSAMYWELRSLTVLDDDVLDGARHFDINATSVRHASSTPRDERDSIQNAETRALKDNIVAVEYEHITDAETDETVRHFTPQVADGALVTVLRSTILALQTERRKMLGDIKSLEDKASLCETQSKRDAFLEVNCQVEAAKTQKRIAQQHQNEYTATLRDCRKEIADLKHSMESLSREKSVAELMLSQKEEQSARESEFRDKEKRQLRLRAERAEQEFHSSRRSYSCAQEEFESQRKKYMSEAETKLSQSSERERIQREIHDRTVHCMAAQDAELEVVKSRVQELELDLETAQREHDDTMGKVHAVHRIGMELLATGLKESEGLHTPPLPIAPTSVGVQTLAHGGRSLCARREATEQHSTGTDTYIDIAQRSKATQTATLNREMTFPTNVYEASEQAFVALRQLTLLAQSTRSGYVQQCRMHPRPSARFFTVDDVSGF